MSASDGSEQPFLAWLFLRKWQTGCYFDRNARTFVSTLDVCHETEGRGLTLKGVPGNATALNHYVGPLRKPFLQGLVPAEVDQALQRALHLGQNGPASTQVKVYENGTLAVTFSSIGPSERLLSKLAGPCDARQ